MPHVAFFSLNSPILGLGRHGGIIWPAAPGPDQEGGQIPVGTEGEATEMRRPSGPEPATCPGRPGRSLPGNQDMNHFLDHSSGALTPMQPGRPLVPMGSGHRGTPPITPASLTDSPLLAAGRKPSLNPPPSIPGPTSQAGSGRNLSSETPPEAVGDQGAQPSQTLCTAPASHQDGKRGTEVAKLLPGGPPHTHTHTLPCSHQCWHGEGLGHISRLTTCGSAPPSTHQAVWNDSSTGQVYGSSPGCWAGKEQGRRSALTGRILLALFLVAYTVGQSHGIHSGGRGGAARPSILVWDGEWVCEDISGQSDPGRAVGSPGAPPWALAHPAAAPPPLGLLGRAHVHP